MLRLTTIIFLAIGLTAAPALAGEPAVETTKATAETKIEKRRDLPRQTTIERWRGGPRLRGGVSEEQLRSQAMDVQLLPVNQAFANGGVF